MPNGNDQPGHQELWEALNDARLDIAELKGMISMHFKDGSAHHVPPCRAVQDVQRSILSATGAAVLALITALGAMAMELFRR
jgi:hypothetical protein